MQPGGAHTTRRLHNTKKRALILVSLNAPFLLRRRLCVHARQGCFCWLLSTLDIRMEADGKAFPFQGIYQVMLDA